MDLCALPDEILHAIFCELDGSSVMRCRLVCHRWKEAADSLTDKNWKKICSNEGLYEDYIAARKKFGLSWRESFKSLTSWVHLQSYEMSSKELCDGIEHFFIGSQGIVACLQNNRHRLEYGFSDTVVYYDTATFQECGREEFKKPFLSSLYFENEYLKVLVQLDCSLCIIINETKEEFIVGKFSGLQILFYNGIDQFTVIGKDVYFKNSPDDVIYVSKLINNKYGTPTIKTDRLEAFLENHESYEEDVVGFAVKDGKLFILSDEGNKGNIYQHENADFTWITQFSYDEMHIYIELQEHGFNWKSPAIYRWLQKCTDLKPTFFSHGNVYLTTRNYAKTICVHYFPYYVYCPGHLQKVFKGKPKRSISIKKLFPDSSIGMTEGDRVSQLGIIETPTSHKVLVKIGKKVFVLEFVMPEEKKKMTSRSRKTLVYRKKVLQAKKKSVAANKTGNAKKKTKAQTPKKTLKKKAVYIAKKRPDKKGKKTVTKERKAGHKHRNKSGATKSKTTKGAGTSPYKHSYATRASVKK